MIVRLVCASEKLKVGELTLVLVTVEFFMTAMQSFSFLAAMLGFGCVCVYEFGLS